MSPARLPGENSREAILYNECVAGPQKSIHEKAAGCFLESGGEFLILRRAADESQAGKWGIPAGKVEPGETEKEAVIREVREEIGFLIPPEKLEFIRKIPFAFSGKMLDFFAFRVHLASKIEVALNQEHQAYLWTTGKECYARNDLIGGVHRVLEEAGYASTTGTLTS